MEGDGPDSGRQPAGPTEEAEQSPFGQFQDLINKTRQHKAYSLIGYVIRRFSRDSCASVASSLSYTSLLAMVPLLAIGLAMFAAFPAFSDLRDEMLRALIANVAPSLATMVEEYLQGFINNAGQT